jgi:hypothetical protein
MYIRNTTYHSDTFLMPIIIYSFNHHDTIPHQSSPLASVLLSLCASHDEGMLDICVHERVILPSPSIMSLFHD